MVSVIIVNYNTLELTKNCIRSIIQHTQEIPYEIILVDNASSDGSADAIEKDFPQVKLIRIDKNIGFGPANNVAVKVSKGKFLFFLNSDTELIENSIKKLYLFYTSNTHLNIGVLGGVLLDVYRNPNGCGGIFPTVRSIIKEKFRMLPLGKKIFPLADERLLWHLDKPFFEIDYIIGADMFMSKRHFLEFGGFDETFFMYYEETDLQLNMRRKGLKQYVFTGTKIIHSEIINPHDKKIKPQTFNWRRGIIHKSQIHYVKKNYKSWFFIYMLIDIPLTLLNVINRKFTFQENIDYIKGIKKAYRL